MSNNIKVKKHKEPILEAYKNKDGRTAVCLHIVPEWEFRDYAWLMTGLIHNLARAFDVPVDDLWAFMLACREVYVEKETGMHADAEYAGYAKRVDWN